MIDHMLVDLKKYYEGETPNYVGKKLKMPKGSCCTYTFNLGKDSSLPKDEAKEPQPIRIYDDLWPQDMSYELTPKVIGQLETGNSVFLLIPFYDHIFKHTHCVWIELSEYLQNGGVSASLTHVYHAFTAFRSEVKSMIDHLLVNLKKYYEGNEKNYIGKTINDVQNSIAAFSYTPACDKNNSGFSERFERYDSFKSDFLNGIRIIGQATLQNGDILLMIPADYSGSYNQSLFVKLTDILKNGGGIA